MIWMAIQSVVTDIHDEMMKIQEELWNATEKLVNVINLISY
jgi:hypothetical protein